MKEETERLMELVETKIGNGRQPLYEHTCTEATYYTVFKDKSTED